MNFTSGGHHCPVLSLSIIVWCSVILLWLSIYKIIYKIIIKTINQLSCLVLVVQSYHKRLSSEECYLKERIV